MRYIVLGTVFLYVLLLQSLTNSYEYEIRFFKQRVDHFSYGNEDYFLQRYLISYKFWNKTGGPIFFYTGNEGDITMFANNTGFMWEIAPDFQAMIIFAEHRYYGQSLPFGDKSFSTVATRGYLTSEQALADFAVLISYIKENVPFAQNSAVIAFGGSYGGMLSAWMRMKYPHIINGALASSAPILQFNKLTPCGKFAEIVTNDFSQSSIQCSKSIRRSWSVIRKIGNTTSGMKWLTSKFNVCSPLSTESDISAFINWIAETWNNLAMTDYPYPTNFLVPLPANPVNEACKYLKNSSEPDYNLLNHIFEAVSVFQNYTGTVKCFNLSVSSGTSLGDAGWSYQSCTEMVMPMCQNGVTDMFEPSGWNLSIYSKICEKQWQVKPDPQKAIIMYGGKNISASSNIFFSNGKLDPWSGGGVLETLSESLIAYVIENAAHHLDLRSSNAADPASVTKVRRLEKVWINKWIKSAK